MITPDANLAFYGVYNIHRHKFTVVNGTIDGYDETSVTVPYGTRLTIEATVPVGKVFRRWTSSNLAPVTVNPYMGSDALKPFLDYADRGVIILCRTSNAGGNDLQNLVCDGMPIYEHVAVLTRDKYNYNQNAALVIGATYPEELGRIRAICPELPFLVPGVGAQGGDVAKVLEHGLAANGYGLIINSSRGIIYASNGDDFADAARNATIKLRDLIRSCRP